MKLIAVFGLLFLLFSTFDSHKVRRSRAHMRLREEFLTNLYFFACGAIGTFIGRRDLNPNNIFADFKACIPPEWLQKAGIATNDEAEPFTYLKDGESTFRKIMEWSVSIPIIGTISVDRIIETICKYVDPIISALSRRRFRRAFLNNPTTKTIARQLQKYVKFGKFALGRRVFLQVRRRSRNSSSGILDSIGEFISSGTSKIIANYIKPFFTKIHDWVKSFWEKVQIAIKIYKALVCLKDKATSLVNDAKKAILGLITAFSKLATGWVGFIQIIVKTVCQWATLKQAILDLIDSFKNEGTTKWNLIGKFVGGLLAAMSKGYQ